MKERFFEALEHLGVTYNQETGWLSEKINFVVYKNRTNLPVERVFIIGEQFLILRQDSFRSVKFENIQGFNLIKEG